MFKRTILSTLLALVICIGVAYFFRSRQQADFNFVQFFIIGLFYGFPVLLIGVILFLLGNLFTSIRIKRGDVKNIGWYFLLFSGGLGLLPALGFTIFDYADRGRFFNDPTFWQLFLEYAPSLILVAVGIFVNWILTWRMFDPNFLKRYQEPINLPQILIEPFGTLIQGGTKRAPVWQGAFRFKSMNRTIDVWLDEDCPPEPQYLKIKFAYIDSSLSVLEDAVYAYIVIKLREIPEAPQRDSYRDSFELSGIGLKSGSDIVVVMNGLEDELWLRNSWYFIVRDGVVVWSSDSGTLPIDQSNDNP